MSDRPPMWWLVVLVPGGGVRVGVCGGWMPMPMASFFFGSLVGGALLVFWRPLWRDPRKCVTKLLGEDHR